MKHLFGIVFLASLSFPAATAQDEPSEACRAWFADTGISPGSPSCMAECVSATVGMGTYHCPGSCEYFCQSNPANDCSQHEGLRRYEDVVQNELPAYESFNDQEKGILKGMFEKILDGFVEAGLQRAGNRVPYPALKNANNINKMLQGNELDGAIGIYSDLAWALLPPSQRAEMEGLMRDFATGLSGTGSSTFAEVQDGANRRQLSTTLEAEGCSGDLTNDYGLPPYQSP